MEQTKREAERERERERKRERERETCKTIRIFVVQRENQMKNTQQPLLR
jgi:hypothetical protein